MPTTLPSTITIPRHGIAEALDLLGLEEVDDERCPIFEIDIPVTVAFHGGQCLAVYAGNRKESFALAAQLGRLLPTAADTADFTTQGVWVDGPTIDRLEDALLFPGYRIGG